MVCTARRRVVKVAGKSGKWQAERGARGVALGRRRGPPAVPKRRCLCVEAFYSLPSPAKYGLRLLRMTSVRLKAARLLTRPWTWAGTIAHAFVDPDPLKR